MRPRRPKRRRPRPRPGSNAPAFTCSAPAFTYGAPAGNLRCYRQTRLYYSGEFCRRELAVISCRSEDFKNLQEILLRNSGIRHFCKKNFYLCGFSFLQVSEIQFFARNSSCSAHGGKNNRARSVRRRAWRAAAGKRVCTVLGHSAAVNWLSFLAEPKIFRICKKPFFANPESGAFARRISTYLDSLSCKFLKFRFLQETLLAARLRRAVRRQPGSSARRLLLAARPASQR